MLVTRSPERAGALSSLLRARGAIPVEAPAIAVTPSRSGPFGAAIREAAEGGSDWVAFTSAEGVEAWFARAATLGLDARGLRAKVAAVGPGTAEALRERGIIADLVPRTYTTEALGRAFPGGSGRVLLPRADIAPTELERLLGAKGWKVERVDAYRSRPARSLPADARAALARGEIDAITFTSASTVEGFVRAAGTPRGPAVVCIGPVTARRAREAGLRVAAVARPHTLEGVVEATERALARRPARGG